MSDYMHLLDSSIIVLKHILKLKWGKDEDIRMWGICHVETHNKGSVLRRLSGGIGGWSGWSGLEGNEVFFGMRADGGDWEGSRLT